MLYKVLEKYSLSKSEMNIKDLDEKKVLNTVNQEIIQNFMNLYDKEVKIVHTNQGLIEKDLQSLYKETEKVVATTKNAITIYDSFIEYLKVNIQSCKEAGDLVNWCGIIENEMIELHDQIATNISTKKLNQDNLTELA